jgi:GNAT superfamily N-acetyltransferase
MPFPPYDSIRRWTDGDYAVTTDPARVELDVVYDWLRTSSYWAQWRTREQQERINAFSRCYTLVHEPSGAQVGFARAVTDHASFAWIGDVFVVDAARGRGLGKFLVRCFTDDLAHVHRLFLGTADAHGLYAQFGFAPPPRQERWMERLLDPPPA